MRVQDFKKKQIVGKVVASAKPLTQKEKNEKEASKIYMKLNPQFAREDKTFGKVGRESPKPQRVAYSNILKQVKMTRKPGGITLKDKLPKYEKDLGER
jgi:hypothetical protein